jgi:DNA-directed RNA polymerase subunit RPC12/RpoP
MSIEKCDGCGRDFRLIKTEMSWPVGVELESYNCPYCDFQYRKKIRGSFSTEKIEA